MKYFVSLKNCLAACCLLFLFVGAASSETEVLEIRLALDLTHNSEGRSGHIETSPHLKIRSGEEAEVKVSSSHDKNVAIRVLPTAREDGSVEIRLKILASFDSEEIERKMRLIVAKNKPAEMEVADESTRVLVKAIVLDGE